MRTLFERLGMYYDTDEREELIAELEEAAQNGEFSRDQLVDMAVEERITAGEYRGIMIGLLTQDLRAGTITKDAYTERMQTWGVWGRGQLENDRESEPWRPYVENNGNEGLLLQYHLSRKLYSWETARFLPLVEEMIEEAGYDPNDAIRTGDHCAQLMQIVGQFHETWKPGQWFYKKARKRLIRKVDNLCDRFIDEFRDEVA